MSPLARDGVPALEDLEAVVPCAERLMSRAVAVVECFQQIPCDPCADACRHGAIKPLAGINDLPVLDEDLCDGCGLCIAKCPGQAVFVVDETYSLDEALVMLPYEFLPLPEVGEVVCAFGRDGCQVGLARVVKVRKGRSLDRTAIISVAVPLDLAMTARHIKPRRERPPGPQDEER
jgi:Fe-S-cluster-containing hydrogenase component 2